MLRIRNKTNRTSVAKTPEKVIDEFISLAFKAVVVSAKAELFGKDVIGREVDIKLVEELKKEIFVLVVKMVNFTPLLLVVPSLKRKK